MSEIGHSQEQCIKWKEEGKLGHRCQQRPRVDKEGPSEEVAEPCDFGNRN